MPATVTRCGLAILRFTAQIPGFTRQLAAKLEAAGADDGIGTVEEAEDLARQLLEERPDLLKVKVHGVDVVDPESELHLVQALARIVFNASHARDG